MNGEILVGNSDTVAAMDKVDEGMALITDKIKMKISEIARRETREEVEKKIYFLIEDIEA